MSLQSAAKAMKTDGMIRSDMKQTYFGKSMASGDFKGDGSEQVFIGAPGYTEEGRSQMGAVYLSPDTAVPHLTPDIDSDGESYSYQRFGYALAALDINRDGVDDLVVSAPSYGYLNMSATLNDYYPKVYNGRVYIYFGKSGTGIASGSKPDLIIQSKDETVDDIFNLGLSLRTSDCNGDGNLDLLVLSPLS